MSGGLASRRRQSQAGEAQGLDSVPQSLLHHAGHPGDSMVSEEGLLPGRGILPKAHAGWVRPDDAAFPRGGRATPSSPHKHRCSTCAELGFFWNIWSGQTFSISALSTSWLREFFVVGADLCTFVCFSVPLASTHWCQQHHSSFPLQVVKIQTVCRQCQMPPGAKFPSAENHWIGPISWVIQVGPSLGWATLGNTGRGYWNRVWASVSLSFEVQCWFMS